MYLVICCQPLSCGQVMQCPCMFHTARAGGQVSMGSNACMGQDACSGIQHVIKELAEKVVCWVVSGGSSCISWALGSSRPQKLQLTEHTGYKNVSKGSWSLAIRLCRYAATKACWPRPSQTAPDHAGRLTASSLKPVAHCCRT